MNIVKFAIAAVMLVFLACGTTNLRAEDAAPAPAAQGDAIRGKVTEVSATSITITGGKKSGGAVTKLAITADTKVTVDGVAATAADIKVDDFCSATKSGDNAATISIRRMGGKGKKGGGDAAAPAK